MVRKIGQLTVLAVLALSLIGCMGTMQAIENRNMTTYAKMSNTIFLEPTERKTIYVNIKNTSDMQEIDFNSLIRAKLTQNGYTITNDYRHAEFVLQVNVLYMGYEKQGLTADGMLAGGFGGALVGSTIGSGWRGPMAAGVGGAVVGSIVGGVVGSMIHVDTYLGCVDIQVKEAVQGAPVEKQVTTNAANGMGNQTVTTYNKTVNRQEYRTRIVVMAKQTNINKNEAAGVLSNKLATEIGGIF